MAIPTRMLPIPADSPQAVKEKATIAPGEKWTQSLHATCDIAPVLRYIVQSNNLADSEIGMDELLALHKKWSEREDIFCAQFDQEDPKLGSVQEAAGGGLC